MDMGAIKALSDSWGKQYPEQCPVGTREALIEHEGNMEHGKDHSELRFISKP